MASLSLGAPDRVTLRRARMATCLVFLLFGAALGTWTARIPAIKERLGLSDGQLSIGLLVFAVGAIVGMQVIGRLVDRYGSRKIMIPAAYAEGAALVLPAFAPNLAILAAALFTFGVAHGLLNIATNANAVAVERAWGKSIMSSFHGVFSLGGFLGAAIGGLFAHADLDPAITFVTVGAAAMVLATCAARWSLSGEPSVSAPSAAGVSDGAATPQRGSDGVAPMPGVLFLGVLAFCCLVGEGAAADWSTVYVRDSLGSSPGFAAAAYAAFSIMMTAGRLAGDRLVAALGPVRLVRACGVLAAVGLGAGLLVDHPVAGVIGFGCLGAGLSNIAPQVFSAAGNHDPARAGQAIARVASLGFLGFVVGPVLIGAAAELFSLPVALAIPVLLALFVAASAAALRPAATSA